MVVRPSAVAGQFYPGDADHCGSRSRISLPTSQCPSKTFPNRWWCRMRLRYSGATAAAAFATLRNGAQTITRVVLIGPAHYVHVRGIAAATVDAFETPLGRVPVNRAPWTPIAGFSSVIQDDAAHAPSTLSKLSCRFCKPFSLPSEWYRCWSVM